ncbi:hypothetical protein P280DRAFT_466145 [Massarina eburnea CBS 473.64]|uniref:Asteroid domain-containing protein n=1 Tax=Massarina eburnea CBS 473.64 TaxID=1395130 RepID=A0A6A6SBE0_9PLEO|nr:hypothetical protein P280DRAFT_466145 [Massarina eburnea CBS 473.64]
MGIAGLARRLEPYRARIEAADLAGYRAIVDGPSLAYHAEKLAYASLGNHSRSPSYVDINRKALSWLKALEGLNIKVAAILFDGSLPATKVDERLSRLNHSNSRVRLLRIQYPNAACPIPTPLRSISYPFLAPSLREALADSEYASATHMVPGEADDWCAPYADDAPRPVIFSSDSDLLLYDYSAECRIVMFDNVELWPEPQFNGFSPVQTARSFGLTSLIPFAYCLSLDKHLTFSALLEGAKDVDPDSSDYREFSSRYERTETSDAYFEHFRSHPTTPQYLDVRISEFFDQVNGNITKPVVYLPLLVEDPNAASAWNMGNDIRLLAYSLFTKMPTSSFSFFSPNEKHRPTVEEYRRKAQGVPTHQVQLYKPDELVPAARDMADNISTWMQWMMDRQVPRDLIWPLIAANLVLLDLPKAPKISFLISVLTADFNNSWDFVHLTARLHATLYSLRILQQCVCMWLAEHQYSSAEPRQHMDTLYRILADMPGIAELILVPGQDKKSGVDLVLLRDLLEEIYTAAEMEIPSEKVSKNKAKKVLREAERKERQKREKEAEGERSFNVFDLLNRAPS